MNCIWRSVFPEDMGSVKRPQLVRAPVQSGASGEKSVTVADMNHIVPGSAGGRKSPRAAVVPEINIVLRVKGNHSLPCRSAGGLNPHTFGTRACQQSIGIGVAKDHPWSERAACGDHPPISHHPVLLPFCPSGSCNRPHFHTRASQSCTGAHFAMRGSAPVTRILSPVENNFRCPCPTSRNMLKTIKHFVNSLRWEVTDVNIPPREKFIRPATTPRQVFCC